MPEKPEVITIVRSLDSHIKNRTIKSVSVYWDSIIAYPSVNEFQDKIKNQTIERLSTRGKWIVITLSDYLLLIHLRMEGKFFFRTHEDERNKHEHVIFTLDNGVEWRYHDVRKFGKMYLLDKKDAWSHKPLVDLGYEFDDPNLTKDYLYQKLKVKRLPIKTSLLDQSIISGIGNIYDDEILFLCHISPLKKSNKITKKECEEIIKNTKEVLIKAISLGGTTIRTYSPEEGVHGLFQNYLLVHGKKECPICGRKIEKIYLGGRGTYYCPNCQK